MADSHVQIAIEELGVACDEAGIPITANLMAELSAGLELPGNPTDDDDGNSQTEK